MAERTEADAGQGSPAGAIDAVGVTTVVLNWNRATDTLGCLRSLDGLATSVLVVDNGSTDGSEQRIRAERPTSFLVRVCSFAPVL